jgi:hypothetical protein
MICRDESKDKLQSWRLVEAVRSSSASLFLEDREQSTNIADSKYW